MHDDNSCQGQSQHESKRIVRTIEPKCQTPLISVCHHNYLTFLVLKPNMLSLQKKQKNGAKMSDTINVCLSPPVLNYLNHIQGEVFFLLAQSFYRRQTRTSFSPISVLKRKGF